MEVGRVSVRVMTIEDNVFEAYLFVCSTMWRNTGRKTSFLL